MSTLYDHLQLNLWEAPGNPLLAASAGNFQLPHHLHADRRTQWKKVLERCHRGSCDLPWFTYFSDPKILYGWEWLMADVSKILCPFFPGCERLCWRLKSSDLECLGAERSRRWRSHRCGMTYGAKWSGSGQPCTYRLYCIWCTVLLIHTHIYSIYIHTYIHICIIIICIHDISWYTDIHVVCCSILDYWIVCACLRLPVPAWGLTGEVAGGLRRLFIPILTLDGVEGSYPEMPLDPTGTGWQPWFQPVNIWKTSQTWWLLVGLLGVMHHLHPFAPYLSRHWSSGWFTAESYKYL